MLLLHGFTGSPWELRPLADALVAAGYSVALPLLAGHGTRVEDLDRTGWQDWLASARAALDHLAVRCDRVHFVGMSMGALLALLLARQPIAAPLRSVTLLAPAMALAPWQAAVIRTFGQVGHPKLLGKKPRDLADGLAPPAYAQLPVAATVRLLELMDVVQATAAPLAVPTMVLHGSEDPTIPAVLAQRLVTPLLGSAGIHTMIRGAGHLLLREKQAPQVLARLRSAMEVLEPYGPDAAGPVPLGRQATS